MVRVKLEELAKKLNKSITDIAKETKLNRNTITALYHNKVDGIKFETLERICAKYKVNIRDILENENKKTKTEEGELVYKQEGSAVPFTCWPWMMATTRLNEQFLDFGWGKLWVYFLKDYILAYWEKKAMEKLAKNTFEKYSDQDKLNEFFNHYLESVKDLKQMYFELDKEQILNYNNEEILQYHNDLMKAYEKIWDNALFIDAFDPGYDQEMINEIMKKYNFSKEEVQVLTTSEKMTFSNERIHELLKIIKNIINKNFSDYKLKRFIQEDAEIKKYIKNFDYYLSNYAQINHITEGDILAEIKKYLKNKELFNKTISELNDYTKIQQAKVKGILKKYKLQENPLYFFSLLTYWRENRKQVNMMGWHVFEIILDALEKKTGINKKYLKYLAYDEISHVLKGTIDQDVLKKRKESGCMVLVSGRDYQMLVGEQAASLKNELEKRITTTEDAMIIPGQVACQGYAKGIARIILNEKDFSRFKEGEILVTGMTRPEFIPLMKKAAAIVTNEGGITCHAAIVSRELNKPCIIGTQNATQLIKDGDLIEVRANHGTVRILK